MISSNGRSNFLVAHWDWLVAGFGALFLLASVAFFFISEGGDPDAAAAEEKSGVSAAPQNGQELIEKKAEAIAVMELLRKADEEVKKMRSIPTNSASFLASEKRIRCRDTGHTFPATVKDACPHCKMAFQPEKTEEKDKDKDGMDDAWERLHGIDGDGDHASVDSDNDGFTNYEEYLAGTDPKNANDHPDYVDSLKIQLPLKENYVPFVFRKATKIPAGWRIEFFDPKRKNDYGKSGRGFSVKVGEPIIDASAKDKCDYGFKLVDYEQKSVKQKIKGTEGLTKSVDVSEVTIERIKDRKTVTLCVQSSGVRLSPVDVQATLVYSRGGTKTFEVVTGAEITLNGTKFKVVEIKPVEKGAKVTVENLGNSKRTVLSALE